VTTPGLVDCISGAILYEETIRQQKKDGTPFVRVITDAGIIPGIEVDTGEQDMAVLPYEQYLKGFATYLQQLTMESNGKNDSSTNTLIRPYKRSKELLHDR
jgi:fructose-bisphosphate aldolase class I